VPLPVRLVPIPSFRLRDTDRFWCVFSMQLCIPICRSGSSLAARCLFAWRSYRFICGDIIAEQRMVNGDGMVHQLRTFWAEAAI
jgi:hypothetical protein